MSRDHTILSKNHDVSKYVHTHKRLPSLIAKKCAHITAILATTVMSRLSEHMGSQNVWSDKQNERTSET